MGWVGLGRVGCGVVGFGVWWDWRRVRWVG